jgi:hypothetical protein
MSEICHDQMPASHSSPPIPPSRNEPDLPRTAVPETLADDRFFHLTMTGLAFLFVAASAVGSYWVGITLLPQPVLVRAALIAALVGLALFYRWRRAQRMINLLVIVAWSVLFSALYSVPQYVAGRSPAALCDAWLARLDRALGIEVPAILQAIAGFPGLGQFLAICYYTLLPLMTLAIILPAFCGHMQRAKEYCVACLASAALGIPLFAFLPALGPWTHYQYPASVEQENYLRVLLELRSGGPYSLDLGHVEGVITFPSFHTILPTLAAFALWPVRYVRWPAAIVAGLIALSALTTGWHYVVDVLAGIILAAAACAVAKAYSRAERGWKRRHSL